MTYVEPQHNATARTSAARGSWMVDEGEEAGFPAGRPHATTVPNGIPDETASIAEKTPALERRAAGRGGLSEHTRKRLAAQLRTMYDTVAQQPVPDRFADLIARLDGGERETV